MKVVKAHALGNDFLLAPAASAEGDRGALARALCDRHRGLGADGVIFFDDGVTAAASDDDGASVTAAMDLRNADGSYSELSGNGVRCLAAWLARAHGLSTGASIAVATDAGRKHLELLEVSGTRCTFRAAMGQPEDIARQTIDVDGAAIDAITLRVGNPQCVVLGAVTEERLHSVAARLSVHSAFPQGANVELASVDAPDHVRILIWERGVGPTTASGTGACAAAVAAMQFGGARRDARVTSPGGTQRVEWRADGLYLTGWAEVVFEGSWLAQTS